MKKIILRESQLNHLINKIILNEQEITPFYNGSGNYWATFSGLDDEGRKQEVLKIQNYVNSLKEKTINYFLNFYSNPNTVSKFKNKNNVEALKSFIKTIKVKLNNSPQNNPQPNAQGYVNSKDPSTLYLNLYTFWTGKISITMSEVMDHEIGHSISGYLKTLGETSTQSSQGYYKPEDEKDNYIASNEETYTRIQRLRSILGLKGNEDGVTIMNNIYSQFKNGMFKIPNYSFGKTQDNRYMVFKRISQEKGMLTDLWHVFSPMTYNNNRMDDIAALFAKYSQVKNNMVYLDLNFIGRMNQATKAIQ